MAHRNAVTNEDAIGKRAERCAEQSDEEMAEIIVSFFETLAGSPVPAHLRLVLSAAFVTIVHDIRAGERLRMDRATKGGVVANLLRKALEGGSE